jgi:hypothetical protein
MKTWKRSPLLWFDDSLYVDVDVDVDVVVVVVFFSPIGTKIVVFTKQSLPDKKRRKLKP